MKQRLKIRGLRKRWMMNSVGPVVLILALIAVFCSVGIGNLYYNSALASLKAKASAGGDYFNTYSMKSYNEYYRNASLYAATFDDSDRIELQFLNPYGRIEMSTRGLLAGTAPNTPEVERTLQTGEIEVFRGRDPHTGEQILTACAPLQFNGTIVGLMRYVTSARQLAREVALAVWAIVGATAVICVLLTLSSLLFINSVVAPVAAVTEAAKKISSGSYGVQIPNYYHDEMQELVSNINDMSLKIGQSEKMQTEFISSVSHELRTPLTAINGWGETLLEDEMDTEQLRRGVSIIVKEARRLTNMVEELLEFSKMQDGRFTLQVESMDLQAELEDAVYTYHQLFQQDGITLEYDGEELYTDPIIGDSERIKQVLCNLLDNAAKHGGSGKRIVVSMQRVEDEYHIVIRDFGPGIPEAELPFIKQKFYKGSSKARGSGIGLAVCDEIVERHGGTLTIANAEGGGTQVTVALPIEEHG